jgi:hypothetical protein
LSNNPRTTGPVVLLLIVRDIDLSLIAREQMHKPTAALRAWLRA